VKLQGDDVIIVAGTIDMDPAKVTEAMEAAKVMMAATRQEPGNQEYVFSVDPVVPGKVRIFELWDDQASLDAHGKTPHMAEFGAKVGGFGVIGMDIKKYVVASTGQIFSS
jgi:quinol monooxygenase YgiN